MELRADRSSSSVGSFGASKVGIVNFLAAFNLLGESTALYGIVTLYTVAISCNVVTLYNAVTLLNVVQTLIYYYITWCETQTAKYKISKASGHIEAHTTLWNTSVI